MLTYTLVDSIDQANGREPFAERVDRHDKEGNEPESLPSMFHSQTGDLDSLDGTLGSRTAASHLRANVDEEPGQGQPFDDHEQQMWKDNSIGFIAHVRGDAERRWPFEESQTEIDSERDPVQSTSSACRRASQHPSLTSESTDWRTIGTRTDTTG